MDWYRCVDFPGMAYLRIAQHDPVSKTLNGNANDEANRKYSKFGYEFFKATHLFAAVVFIVTFFWHCDYTLTSW